MSAAEAARLDARHGVPGRVRFTWNDALGGVVADITAEGATATLALRGAHLVAWTPAGAAPVLWLSPSAKIVDGKGLRGGVPLCWPWFADHPADRTKPFHGLVRIRDWQPAKPWPATASPGPATLAFELVDPAPVAPLHVRFEVTIGTRLTMALVTTNQGPSPVALTEALHTYFAVSDVDRISVTGLDGVVYLDKTDGFARKRQAGPITFAGETDRIYLAGGATRIVDAGLTDTESGRTIALDPEGSGATVVWNAGPERAKAMADMPGDSWRRYVCVETANAADAAVTLAPGAVHRMAVTISAG